MSSCCCVEVTLRLRNWREELRVLDAIFSLEADYFLFELCMLLIFPDMKLGSWEGLCLT